MSFRHVGRDEITGRRVGRLLDSLMRPDPAEAVREAPVLAVASGKGGTGKSFLTACLAVLLADRRRSVIVVDCDFGLATTHLLLGVEPRATLHHVVDGRVRPEDALHRSPFGPTLVPGASGVQAMASPGRAAMERFAAAVGEWSRAADVVLLDVGAGLSAPALATLAAADQVVLVTQPELASLTDAYAVIKCLRTATEPQPGFSVIVNRVHDDGEGPASFQKLAEVARRFLGVSLHYLGDVIDESAVGLRRLGQAPLVVRHPTCRAAIQIRSVLARLTERAGPLRSRVPPSATGVSSRIRAHLSNSL